jgi:hypothetical protein
MKLSLNLNDYRRPQGNGPSKAVEPVSEGVHAYERVLVQHAWVHVPANSPIRFYTHPLKPMDRIQVFNDVWSHSHFDGESWLVTARTRGNDAASLDVYLGRYFR